MIYCNLKGGLGNIIFQIIATKSFAKDRNVECSFPNLHILLTHLNEETHNNPSLKHSFEYLEKLDLIKNLNTMGPQTGVPTFSFGFDYYGVNLPDDNFFVDGFFQSEKFFAHNRKHILEWLKIPENIKQTIDEKYNHILDKQTTSIHVRRGDYLRFSHYHFVQPLEYFLECIDMLKNETELFVIFSDDIEWCKNEIKLPNCVYIENEKDYIELYLMSLCKNNIISNSSFSWWGAWLNNNENKKVIGPTRWFGPSCGLPTKDILPDSWIKI